MKWMIPLFMAVIASEAISLFELQLMEWEEYKIEHRKKYTIEEDEFRMKIYLQNKLKIEKHNLDYEKGIYTYKLGMNKFGDMLPHEYYNMTHCLKHNKRGTKKVGAATFIVPENLKEPEQIDWRELGAVTPVKNQGNCGSCWAFSAVGCLEGQHFRKTGNLTFLSEQNLVDCSSGWGNSGCKGGGVDRAFSYVKDNGGIDTETSYPYEGKDDKCRYNPVDSGATDTGYVDLEVDETKLMKAVAAIGPISVAIDAQDDFVSYKEGVYYSKSCTSYFLFLNHAVLVVGYGKDEKSGMDYWLVKNSWGEEWGEKGYIKMARNRNNNCGIASMASYPLV